MIFNKTKQNDNRVIRAAEVLERYEKETGSEASEDGICDLLADIRHYCNTVGRDFYKELERSREHFEAECYEAKQEDEA